MREYFIPLVFSLFVLLNLELTGIQNPIYYLSNDFYIESYQATSSDKTLDEIVIVNISDLSTDEIRDQFNILSKYNPSVIGIDYFLPDTTSIEIGASPFKNTVLPLLFDTTGAIQYAKNTFSNYAEYGSIEIYSSSFFEPFINIHKRQYPLFATKILELHNRSRYDQLTDRGYEKEAINYLGNISSFTYLGDLTSIKKLDVLKEIKGKILLMGYTGINNPYPNSYDNYDSHNTPKGQMFGVVILANIIRTLLGNYITPISPLIMAVLIVILAVINTLVIYTLSKIKYKYLIIKVIQFIEVIASFVVASYVIHQWNIYLDYELTVFAVILVPEVDYWYHSSRKQLTNVRFTCVD